MELYIGDMLFRKQDLVYLNDIEELQYNELFRIIDIKDFDSEKCYIVYAIGKSKKKIYDDCISEKFIDEHFFKIYDSKTNKINKKLLNSYTKELIQEYYKTKTEIKNEIINIIEKDIIK
jgi:hypothetical protein